MWKRLTLRAVTRSHSSGSSVPSGAGIAGWVVANRHPMHNCDPRLDFDALKLDLPEPYRTATVVPLLRNDAVLGAMALYSADLASYTLII